MFLGMAEGIIKTTFVQFDYSLEENCQTVSTSSRTLCLTGSIYAMIPVEHSSKNSFTNNF